MANVVATAEIDIAASPERVWIALTDPAEIAIYMFGAHVDTNWQPGSAITWRGEYEGKAYADKGEILVAEPGRRLKLTHFSPLIGQEDRPENYHTVTYELSGDQSTTHLALQQDNNADDAEAERAAATWTTMLLGLKRSVEGS